MIRSLSNHLWDGLPFAAFQAGTKVWFATSTNGSWTTQLLVDAGAPKLSAAAYSANVVFRTASAAWHASRLDTTMLLTTTRLGDDGATTAAAVYSNIFAFVAVDSGSGSTLYRSDYPEGTSQQSFAQRITGLSADYPYLFVQLEGTGIQVLLVADGFRNVQTISNIGRFDADATDSFAGNGTVYTWTIGTVPRPFDRVGDGIDVDCDGSD